MSPIVLLGSSPTTGRSLRAIGTNSSPIATIAANPVSPTRAVLGIGWPTILRILPAGADRDSTTPISRSIGSAGRGKSRQIEQRGGIAIGLATRHHQHRFVDRLFAQAPHHRVADPDGRVVEIENLQDGSASNSLADRPAANASARERRSGGTARDRIPSPSPGSKIVGCQKPQIAGLPKRSVTAQPHASPLQPNQGRAFAQQRLEVGRRGGGLRGDSANLRRLAAKPFPAMPTPPSATRPRPSPFHRAAPTQQAEEARRRSKHHRHFDSQPTRSRPDRPFRAR